MVKNLVKSICADSITRRLSKIRLYERICEILKGPSPVGPIPGVQPDEKSNSNDSKRFNEPFATDFSPDCRTILLLYLSG